VSDDETTATTPASDEAADGGETSEAGLELAPEPPPSAELVATLARERDDLRDQLLRRRADFENYRRRVERDRQAAGQEAIADLLKAMVATLDHLDLAVSTEGSEGALRDGVVLIQRGLFALLEGRGLVVDDPIGKPFDPERHQALSQEASALPEGAVVRVLGKGYAYKDKLLRPALVVVSGPSDTAPTEAVH